MKLNDAQKTFVKQGIFFALMWLFYLTGSSLLSLVAFFLWASLIIINLVNFVILNGFVEEVVTAYIKSGDIKQTKDLYKAHMDRNVGKWIWRILLSISMFSFGWHVLTLFYVATFIFMDRSTLTKANLKKLVAAHEEYLTYVDEETTDLFKNQYARTAYRNNFVKE